MFIPKRRLFASFWDLSPLEGPPGHINPKTIWDKTLQQLAQSPLAPLLVLFLFCLPLSQSLVAHSSGLFGTSRPVFPLSVFLTCNVGMKNGIPCTFSSGRTTSGNPRPSFRVFWGASQSLFAASGFPDVSHQDEKRPLMHF